MRTLGWLALGATILGIVIRQLFWDAAAGYANKRIAAAFGITEDGVVTAAASYIVPLSIAAFVVGVSYWLGLKRVGAAAGSGENPRAFVAPMWRLRIDKLDRWPLGWFVPLRLACARAHKLTYDSDVGEATRYAEIKRMFPDPARYYADYFLFMKRMPAYGTHCGKGVFERVPEDALRYHTVSRDMQTLTDRDTNEPVYTGLSVRRSDISAQIRALQLKTRSG